MPFGSAQGKENPVAERSRSAGFSDKFLRPSTPLREQKFIFGFALKKIRSLSGAEAPDFHELIQVKKA
jgi:hypothetical protein